jgi:hypothetical protein
VNRRLVISDEQDRPHPGKLLRTATPPLIAALDDVLVQTQG